MPSIREPFLSIAFLTLFMSIAADTSAQSSAPSSSTSLRGKIDSAPLAQSWAQPDKIILPVRSVIDPGVTTTRQAITPAGVQSVFEDRVNGVAFGDSDDIVYAETTSRQGSLVYELNWQTNQVLHINHAAANRGMQSITFVPATGTILLTGTATEEQNGKMLRSVQLVSITGQTSRVVADHLGDFAVAGAAISQGAGPSKLAVVPLTFNDQAAIVNLETNQIQAKVRTGIAPFGAVINNSQTVAYVSNWGGRFTRPGDRTMRTGLKPDADQVVVDGRGIASTGIVSRIDLTTGKVTAEIPVGLHPTSLAWNEPQGRLYVANSNTDTISVIDTDTNQTVRTFYLQPFGRKIAGISPEALHLSKDGRQLFVACAGINAIAVIDLANHIGEIQGLIPTGWYPSHLALSPDGKYLAVSTLLGVGSGWKNAPIDSLTHSQGTQLERGPTRRYVNSCRGTIHVIPVPDAAQLAGYTTAALENNHFQLAAIATSKTETAGAQLKPAAMPVPLRAGDPSPIEHIVYIIKENRSYDQFFGGLGEGNGDPVLQAYDDTVIPNHRKLARDFVLLDNFYATGGDSGDGHQWVTQATETDYPYWPGYDGRSYPYDGSDPLAPANSGFIWDLAQSRGKTVQDFGEYVEVPADQIDADERAKELKQWENGGSFEGKLNISTPMSSLDKILARDYPYWTLAVPDVVRASILLHHLKEWEAKDDMPNLIIVQLPSDHTQGTRPDFSTPKACLADNDLALGQIVEGISHSKFWKSSLILVVEDDAQSGLDHVDGHRTVALAISPYIKRGSIDSTFYSQPSMLKTVELILGLPTMSLFDLIANGMQNSFQAVPDFTPYTAVRPEYSIDAMNPSVAQLSGQAKRDAIASAHMNFQIPDAAPTEKLDRILWRDAKGLNRRYPATKHALFAPYSLDLTDEEKEERDR
jgi:YVTN family beta-propeller protein